jgi:ATP-dependent helicase HepA
VSQLPRFSPGQCWVSVSEPELGLGKVISADRRFVEVAFAGNDSKRKYGAGSPPLRRIIFKAGDIVKDASGVEHRITSAKDADAKGTITYVCGEEIIPEAAIIDSISGSPAPLQRLFKGISDRCEDFSLRTELLQLQTEILQSPIRGFAGGRMELLPHQLSIASEVTSRRCVRVLLADETGLGKTIEACLILHRFILTGRVHRCLICVPESLLHQWFIELLRRFNLMFRLFSKEHFDSLRDGTNPFLDDQLGIISIGFLANDGKLCDKAVQAGWDMVIVDEAHHLRPGGKEYECVRRLSEKTDGLILLTATPEQSGGRDRFLKLLDCLGVGRVMFRNTRRIISGFPRRIVHIEPLAVNEAIKNRIRSECKRLLSGECLGISSIFKEDPRVVWLIDLLKERAVEKFLVICAAKENAIALREALLGIMTIDVALFHEDMTLLQRDRNAAWFTEEYGARVLVSSEIGSEGRNFQCCHNLVLLDLPLEPEVLEQRIGRLDRIGQGPVIHIFVPYAVNTYEEPLSRWYHEGLNMFAKNVPAAGMAGEAVRENLILILKGDQKKTHCTESLIAETKRLCREFSQMIEQGDGQLPEISSMHPERALEVKNAIMEVQKKRLSAKVMELLFKHYGVVSEDANNGKWLLMTEYVTDRRFPLPRQEQPLITYDREIALLREDIEFISIDHPMVTDALDLFLSSDFGTSVVGVWNTPGEQELLLEAVFILECSAPENLNAARFLPPMPIRIVVNRENEDITAEFPAALVNPRCKEISMDALQSQIISLEDSVPQMQEKAQALAADAAKPLIERSLSTMRKALDEEIDRLRRLQKKDTSFPDWEVELCIKERDSLEKHLAASRVRCDSIRVILQGSA